MPGEPITRAGYATNGGLGEVGCEDQRVGFGCVVHRPAARLPGGLWELAEHRVPVRLDELERMVHHVAPEQRLFAPGAEADAGVVDTVTGAREKGETLRHFRAVHDDLPGQPGLDHGERNRFYNLLADIVGLPHPDAEPASKVGKIGPKVIS